MRRTTILGIAVTTALIGMPGVAAASPTAACGSGDASTFCTSFDYLVTEADSATPATSAVSGTPAGLAFAFRNTSTAHDQDQNRWWQSVTFSLGQDKAHSPVVAKDLPDGLTVAGSQSAIATCVSPYADTDCPAGTGSAQVKVTTTVKNDPLGLTGTHEEVSWREADFGIADIHNVRTPSGGASYVADIDVTVEASGAEPASHFTRQVTLGGTFSSSGVPSVTMPMSLEQAYGKDGTADLAIDSLTLHWLGRSDETTSGTVDPITLIALPLACGADNAVLSATDRAGTTVMHTRAVTVTGCPEVSSLTAADGGSPEQVKFTATAVAGARPVTGYYWTFGDGTSARTTAPTVTHQYGASVARTVSVLAQDGIGAVSETRSIGLSGTRLGGTQTAARKLSGTIADASTGRLIPGTVHLYRCPSAARSASACERIATSSSTGRWAFTIPRITTTTDYLVSTESSAGRIGGVQYIAARPTSKIKFHAPRKARHWHTFKLNGRVSAPSQPGRYVVIQRKAGSSWRNVTKIRLSRSSTYHKRIKLHRGKVYLRAVVPASKLSLMTVSWMHRVVIR